MSCGNRNNKGQFIKGSMGFNRKHTPESIEKMRLAKLGKHLSPATEFKKGHPAPKTAFKKGHIPWTKGLKGIRLSKITEFKYKNGKGYRHWVFKQMGNICMECEKQFSLARLHAHHIDGNHDNNCATNLIILCRPCHLRLHGRKERIEGYIYGRRKNYVIWK